MLNLGRKALGWIFRNNKYEFLKLEGFQLPPSVKDLIFGMDDFEDSFQFGCLDCVHDLFNLFKYLLLPVKGISAYNSEKSRKNSEEKRLIVLEITLW